MDASSHSGPGRQQQQQQRQRRHGRSFVAAVVTIVVAAIIIAALLVVGLLTNMRSDDKAAGTGVLQLGKNIGSLLWGPTNPNEVADKDLLKRRAWNLAHEELPWWGTLLTQTAMEDVQRLSAFSAHGQTRDNAALRHPRTATETITSRQSNKGSQGPAPRARDPSDFSAIRDAFAAQPEDPAHELVELLIQKKNFLACEPKTDDEKKLLARDLTAKCMRQVTRAMCLAQEGLLYPGDVVDLKRENKCAQPTTTEEFVAQNALYQGIPLPEEDTVEARNLILRNSAEPNFGVIHPLLKPMRILFMIVAHGRAVDTVMHLLATLYRPHHHYLVHVDTQSGYLLDSLQRLTQGVPNIRFSVHRFDSIWGAANLYKVYTMGIEESLDLSWDYFINLSGADLPVMTIEEMETFLGNFVNRRVNFLRSHGKDHKNFIEKQGFGHTFVQCDHHMHHLGTRAIPPSLEMAGGSDWFMLHRGFAEFASFDPDAFDAFHDHEKNGRDAGVWRDQNEPQTHRRVAISDQEMTFLRQLRRYYDHTMLSAESFFHVVAVNTRFCHSILSNNFRTAHWIHDRGCKCQHKNVVDWCGCSPNVYVAKDLRFIQDLVHEPNLFTRKFDGKISHMIIADVHRTIHGKHYGSRDQYWENVYALGRANNPSLTTSLFSFARHATQMLRSRLSCQHLHTTFLNEAFVYFERDTFAAYVLVLKVSDPLTASAETIEVKLTRKTPLIEKNAAHPLSEVLLSLDVGAALDEKERTFMRFGAPMTTADWPKAMHTWDVAALRTYHISHRNDQKKKDDGTDPNGEDANADSDKKKATNLPPVALTSRWQWLGPLSLSGARAAAGSAAERAKSREPTARHDGSGSVAFEKDWSTSFASVPKTMNFVTEGWWAYDLLDEEGTLVASTQFPVLPLHTGLRAASLPADAVVGAAWEVADFCVRAGEPTQNGSRQHSSADAMDAGIGCLKPSRLKEEGGVGDHQQSAWSSRPCTAVDWARQRSEIRHFSDLR